VAVEAPPSTLGKQGKCITRANRQCKIRSVALRGSAGRFAQHQRLHYRTLGGWTSSSVQSIVRVFQRGVDAASARRGHAESTLQRAECSLVAWNCAQSSIHIAHLPRISSPLQKRR